MQWASALRAHLGPGGGALADEERDTSGHAGQHLLLLDSQQCSAAVLLAYAWITRPSAHTVCLTESPLHYQHACRKLGGSTAALTWSDLSAPAHAPASLQALFDSIAERVGPGHCLVLDSLFPLCMLYTPLELTQFVRKLRVLLGPAGTLVASMHGDTFAQHVALLLYEADLVFSLQPVLSTHVSGRLSLDFRGHVPHEGHRECLYTVRDNGGGVDFVPL